MDQLDIIKERWNAQEVHYPHYSADKIKSIIAKQSTGIVKWLLIIAIIEFVVMSGLSYAIYFWSSPSESTLFLMDSVLFNVINIVHFIVICWFIYKFYINYKNISADQPTQLLMDNIIKTRNTMKWYIGYNIIGGFVIGVILTIYMMFYDPSMVSMANSETIADNKIWFYISFALIMMVCYAVLLGVLYSIYLIVYGLLLKRLMKNYKELKQLEF